MSSTRGAAIPSTIRAFGDAKPFVSSGSPARIAALRIFRGPMSLSAMFANTVLIESLVPSSSVTELP